MTDPRLHDLVARLLDGQLDRRQFVRRVAALGAAAPAVAALGTGAAAAAPGAVRRAPSRQIDASTLVIADAMEAAPWITLDPGVFYEINSAAAMNMVYETLYHAPDGTKPTEFLPLLAAELPLISADGREVTIPLRPGVLFHNSGNEMTADDWLFSWNRLRDLNGNGAFLGTTYWSNVEAVDPLTLRLTFDRGVAPLLAILSSIPLAVTDSRAMRENGAYDAPGTPAPDTEDEATAWLNAGNSAGTGPFRVTAYDLSGEVIIERFDDYWGEAPVLERIIWRNIEAPTEQVQAVQGGEADIAYLVDPDAVAAIEADSALQIISGPTLAIEYLALNTKPDVGGPLASRELRQAIGYAIDYEGIINDLMGGAAENPWPATIIPLPLLGTPEAQELAFRQDLTRAQELFDASGVGEATLTFSYGSGESGQGGVDLETLATKLQSDLQQIQGLTIDLNPMDSTTRVTEFRAGNLQFTVSGWTPDFSDSDSYATPFAHSGDTGTAARRVGYNNTALDPLLEGAIYDLDPASRTQTYVEIQRQLVEDVPFLLLYQPDARKPATAAVQGVTPHPIYQLQLRGASKTG